MFRWHVRVVEEKTTHERTNLDVQALSHDKATASAQAIAQGEGLCHQGDRGCYRLSCNGQLFQGSPDPLEVETSSPHISCINLKPAAAVNPIMASHGTRLITHCNLSLALKAVFTTAQNRACEQMFGRTESEHLSCWKRDSAIGSPAALSSAPIRPSRSAGTAPSPRWAWVKRSIRHSPVPLMQAQAGFPPTGSKQTGWGLAGWPSCVYQKQFCTKSR